MKTFMKWRNNTDGAYVFLHKPYTMISCGGFRVSPDGNVQETLSVQFSELSGWRRLHKEECEMGGTCSTHGPMESAFRILIGKAEGRKLLERPNRRWEDNIRRDLREIGWEIVDWMRLTQDRDQWQTLVNTVVNPPTP